MKSFTLLTYSTTNLGDDIQSLAAAQFLPRVDHYVDRDALSTAQSLGETCVIMNGWFKRNPRDWPLPDNIRSLFVSFHIASQHQRELTQPKCLRYYERFGPIGCRDYFTLNLLKSFGVDAYFSGCLTLTFPKSGLPRDGRTYFVDPFGPNPGYRFPHPGDSGFREDLWRCFPETVRRKAVFVTHACGSGESAEARFKKAGRLLGIYSRASLVVTARLHCALPCLAMGTPVIFLYHDKDNPRFQGLFELMRSCSLEDLREGRLKIDWENPPQNFSDFSAAAELLRNRCTQFVEVSGEASCRGA